MGLIWKKDDWPWGRGEGERSPNSLSDVLFPTCIHNAMFGTESQLRARRALLLFNTVLLKGKFSSGIEGALASTLNHDFNWKQLSEMILCIFLLMFSKFI